MFIYLNKCTLSQTNLDPAAPCSHAMCRSWLNLGLVFHYIYQNPVAAERYYITALRIAPNSANVLTNLAELMLVSSVTVICPGSISMACCTGVAALLKDARALPLAGKPLRARWID